MSLKKANTKQAVAPKTPAVTEPATAVVAPTPDSTPEQTTAPAVVTSAPEPVTTPEKTEPAAKSRGKKMVSVQNLRSTFFYQPSTGFRIEAKGTMDMLDDSWLDLQVKAKLLKRIG